MKLSQARHSSLSKGSFVRNARPRGSSSQLITTTRRLCVFYPCGLSSSSSSWEGSNCTLSTRNVPCAIKWSVCTTTTLVGDTYSRTLVHARVRCTRGRGTAYTIPRTLDASVQALRRSLILGQMKTCILKRRNLLSKSDKLQCTDPLFGRAINRRPRRDRTRRHGDRLWSPQHRRGHDRRCTTHARQGRGDDNVR